MVVPYFILMQNAREQSTYPVVWTPTEDEYDENNNLLPLRKVYPNVDEMISHLLSGVCIWDKDTETLWYYIAYIIPQSTALVLLEQDDCFNNDEWIDGELSSAEVTAHFHRQFIKMTFYWNLESVRNDFPTLTLKQLKNNIVADTLFMTKDITYLFIDPFGLFIEEIRKEEAE